LIKASPDWHKQNVYIPDIDRFREIYRVGNGAEVAKPDAVHRPHKGDIEMSSIAYIIRASPDASHGQPAGTIDSDRHGAAKDLR
jgi:hypothetical protein